MGHNLARQLRMLAFVLATALVVTGCSGTAASVSVQEKPAVSVTLTEECAMPIPKEQGRGEPLEDLVPQYAEEYLADPLLKDSVIAFRRWEWNKVYSGLDTVVRENPDYLDAYRLQAEVYLINQHYEAALSQLDRILERDTTDVHALGVSAIIMHILENAEGEQERLAALEQVNAKAAEAVRSMPPIHPSPRRIWCRMPSLFTDRLPKRTERPLPVCSADWSVVWKWQKSTRMQKLFSAAVTCGQSTPKPP